MNTIDAFIVAFGKLFRCFLRPTRSAAGLAIGAGRDLVRARSELVAENALLRQQVIVLRRRIGRPRLHDDDRLLHLILARLTCRWRDTLHVVSPDTLLRWHRGLFKIVWRRRSRPKTPAALIAPAVIGLIQAR